MSDSGNKMYRRRVEELLGKAIVGTEKCWSSVAKATGSSAINVFADFKKKNDGQMRKERQQRGNEGPVR